MIGTLKFRFNPIPIDFMQSLKIKILACLTMGLFSYSFLLAQDLRSADSLINILDNKEFSTDSSKFIVLRSILQNHPDPSKKLQYAQQALAIAEKSDNNNWLYICNLNIGYAYRLQGDMEQALKFFFTSFQLANEEGNSQNQAISSSAIGDVYSIQSDHTNAINYYNRAISYFRDVDDSLKLASTILNLADEYFNVDKLDSALILFNESGVIYDHVGYKLGIAYNLGNIGLVYAKQGKHELAEENINKASLILSELGDRYPIAVYDTYMADIYQKRGDFDRALGYAKKSYAVAMELGLKEQIRDASLKLSELYQSVGDYQQAYTFQSKYIAYGDSINNEETIRKMADLRTEYEVSQKQAEVDLLETQKRIQQVIVFAMAVVLLLLATLAYILYKNNRQKQATNLLLGEQKEEIETQKDQLEELNRTKDKFFSIISHDLRGPVNSFKAVAVLTKLCIEEKKLEELPEVYQHFDTSIDQLSALLDTLLDWAITQQGAISYQPGKVDLEEVVKELTDLFVNMANAKQIQLVSTIKPGLYLWVDLNSLKTILRNLVNNALKFTPEGGKITLSASAEEHNSIAKITVEDTGVGIPTEKLENIFKLSGHNRSWGTQGEKGLGLGLQLVHEFIQMNKGTVKIESQENTGTTVNLELPLYTTNHPADVQERSLSKS